MIIWNLNEEKSILNNNIDHRRLLFRKTKYFEIEIEFIPLESTEMFSCLPFRKCSSPDEDGLRCSNNTIGSSLHCFKHVEKARRLYLKYKKICFLAEESFERIKNISSFHKTYIPLLNSTYQLLINGYEARRTHRNYAFVPELYDKGHDYQFVKLKEMMKRCEEIASHIHNSQDTVLKKEEEPKEEIKTFVEKTKEFKKKKIKDDREDEILLSKYIEANRAYNEEKKSLSTEISLITDRLISRFLIIEEKETIKKGIICLFMQLDHIGYFETDFKFEECSCKKCGNYAIIDLHKLSCDCKECSKNSFLEKLSLNALSALKSSLLKKIGKFCKVIKVIIDFHKIYGNSIFYVDLKLIPYKDGSFNFDFSNAYSKDSKDFLWYQYRRMNSEKKKQFKEDMKFKNDLYRAIHC